MYTRSFINTGRTPDVMLGPMLVLTATIWGADMPLGTLHTSIATASVVPLRTGCQPLPYCCPGDFWQPDTAGSRPRSLGHCSGRSATLAARSGSRRHASKQGLGNCRPRCASVVRTAIFAATPPPSLISRPWCGIQCWIYVCSCGRLHPNLRLYARLRSQAARRHV